MFFLGNLQFFWKSYSTERKWAIAFVSTFQPEFINLCFISKKFVYVLHVVTAADWDQGFQGLIFCLLTWPT